MGARCETVGRHVLPVFRSLVAEELVRTYDLTQIEAAKRLGTTQAAISQYLNSKRAYKSIERCGKLLPRIKALAGETAKRLANKELNTSEVVIDACKPCAALNLEEEPEPTSDDYMI